MVCVCWCICTVHGHMCVCVFTCAREIVCVYLYCSCVTACAWMSISVCTCVCVCIVFARACVCLCVYLWMSAYSCLRTSWRHKCQLWAVCGLPAKHLAGTIPDWFHLLDSWHSCRALWPSLCHSNAMASERLLLLQNIRVISGSLVSYFISSSLCFCVSLLFTVREKLIFVLSQMRIRPAILKLRDRLLLVSGTINDWCSGERIIIITLFVTTKCVLI